MYRHVYPIGPHFHPAPVEKRPLPDADPPRFAPERATLAGVHASNILRKLGAKRRVDAAGIAHKMGLLPVR